MDKFKSGLWLSGLAGLALDALLAAGAAGLVGAGLIKPLLPHPLVIAALAIVLGGFSLAEIPIMVYAIRHLAADPHGRPKLVFGLNAVFVFFAAVYGLPVILVTGSIGWGLALCGLGLIRLAASLLIVYYP